MGSARVVRREQVVEAMGRAPRRHRYLQADRSQTGGRHADQQGGNALDPRREVAHSLGNEVGAGEPSVGVDVRPVGHGGIVGGEVRLQGAAADRRPQAEGAGRPRSGLTDVILPERNRADLDDVPEDVREAMTFHPG